MAGETPNEQYLRLTGKSSQPGKSKYKNEPIERGGIRYDSKAEYAYKGVLDMQLASGQIKGYDYHIKMPLIALGGGLVGYYEVDYLVYTADGKQEYHDVKGKPNDIFPWKAKHVKAQYGVDIILIDSRTLKPKKTK